MVSEQARVRRCKQYKQGQARPKQEQEDGVKTREPNNGTMAWCRLVRETTAT